MDLHSPDRGRWNKLKRILAITFLMIIGFGGIEASGEDWKFYGANANGSFYYDPESITYPSAGVVRVREVRSIVE